MEIKKPAIKPVPMLLVQMVCLKTAYKLRQFRFVVCSFVLVDYVTLSQPIQHRTNFLIKTFCLFFVGCISQFLDEGSGSGCIIAISQPLHLALSDSL
jgi:hypothetical protein